MIGPLTDSLSKGRYRAARAAKTVLDVHWGQAGEGQSIKMAEIKDKNWNPFLELLIITDHSSIFKVRV